MNTSPYASILLKILQIIFLFALLIICVRIWSIIPLIILEIGIENIAVDQHRPFHPVQRSRPIRELDELAMRDAVHDLRFLIAKKLFTQLLHLFPDFSWSCDVLILLFHTFPLAAIQTGMKGFSASFPAVCTQEGTPSQIDSKKECLEGFWNWDVRQTLCCHLLRCTVI